MDVADEYENLVSNPETLEPAIQTFLEQHSELLPVEPFRLGQHNKVLLVPLLSRQVVSPQSV
jgi:hypothetical protein